MIRWGLCKWEKRYEPENGSSVYQSRAKNDQKQGDFCGFLEKKPWKREKRYGNFLKKGEKIRWFRGLLLRSNRT